MALSFRINYFVGGIIMRTVGKVMPITKELFRTGVTRYQRRSGPKVNKGSSIDCVTTYLQNERFEKSILRTSGRAAES